MDGKQDDDVDVGGDPSYANLFLLSFPPFRHLSAFSVVEKRVSWEERRDEVVYVTP